VRREINGLWVGTGGKNTMSGNLQETMKDDIKIFDSTLIAATCLRAMELGGIPDDVANVILKWLWVEDRFLLVGNYFFSMYIAPTLNSWDSGGNIILWDDGLPSLVVRRDLLYRFQQFDNKSGWAWMDNRKTFVERFMLFRRIEQAMQAIQKAIQTATKRHK
jgi:hypothetical protein